MTSEALRTGRLVVALLPVCMGCRPQTPPAPPGPRTWTSEQIAADPVGYLEDQDRQVERQIEERRNRLEQVSQRRAQIDEKRQRLAQNMSEIRNVHDRLAAAVRRADDEDRWPARMGGRAFTREKARAILAGTEQYLQDREPLARAYEETLEKLARMESQMIRESQDLARLRERIALDIERIRLNQGIAELGELRKAETELASFSKMLGAMDENVLDTATVAAREEPVRIDVEKLLQ